MPADPASYVGYGMVSCINCGCGGWQAHPPPVDVGTETDGQLQEAQAALEAQRSQAKALKRRIRELQVCMSCLHP